MSLGFTFGISLSQKTPSRTAARVDSYPISAHGLRTVWTCPTAGALQRLPPAAQQLVALGFAHLGLVAGRFAPHLAHLFRGPLTGGDARQIGGAERSGL